MQCFKPRGQMGLNLTSELNKKGILRKYNVKIGVQADAIERGEDRIAFKETMNGLGLEVPQSEATYSVEGAEKIVEKIGYPVVVRPAYTMGGTGGGLPIILMNSRLCSPRHHGKSHRSDTYRRIVLGWEELELKS